MTGMEKLSNEDRKANFEFLWRSLTEDPGFRLAEDILGGTVLSQERVVKLLRNHKEEWIVDPAEVEGRAAVDNWLAGISQLELAYLCGYIPDVRHLPELNRIKQLVDLPPVRRYFGETYPLALPCVFRLHLQGVVFEAQASIAASGAYQSFGVLLNRFRADPDLEQFLEFLDDFYIDEFGLPELIACFEKPALVVSAMLKPSDQLRPPDRGIRGFFRFVSLSIDLDNLLRACQSLPLAQSAIWFYYAYWFREFGQDVAASGAEVLKNIIGWLASPDAPIEIRSAFPTVQEFSKNWQGTLTRLVEGNYAAPLLDHARLLRTESPRGESEELQSFLARFENYERPRRKGSPPRKGLTLGARLYTLDVPVEKVPDLTGSGGEILRDIMDRTGVKIDVEASGRVNIVSNDEACAVKALQIIRELTATAEIGKTYLGRVSRLADFGAFVEIMPGTDGLLHISEVAEHRIKDIRDELKEGDQVLVKVQAIEGNRIRLSRKAILKEQREKVGYGADGSLSKRRTLSASARRKISLAQKARWAKRASNGQAGTARPKRTMSAAARRKIAAARKEKVVTIKAGKRHISAAGRARIAAAARARWAKIKKGQ